MSALLASVRSVEEACIALDACADIIDCKEPRQGAIGALAPETITRIVETVNGRLPTSATTGDTPCSSEQLIRACDIVADCGVDYVKFGLFDAVSARANIRALRARAAHQDLIAVCFAERYDPIMLLREMADNGLRGVMIDTADKTSGSLTQLWDTRRLSTFVSQARQHGLLCGLAGSLQLGDIAALLPLKADFLGFRGALCAGDRRAALDGAAMMQVREAVTFAGNIAHPIHLNRVALH